MTAIARISQMIGKMNAVDASRHLMNSRNLYYEEQEIITTRGETSCGGHPHAGAGRETEAFAQALSLGDGTLYQRRRHAARLPRTLPCRYRRARAQDRRLRQFQP